MDTEQNAKLRRKGLRIAVAAVAVNLVIGVTFSWSVIENNLIEQWHWSSTAASLPYSMIVVFYALGMLAAGFLQDRFGPRRITLLAAVLFFAACFITSFSTKPWQFTVFFGILIGLAISCAYASALPTAMKWLPESRRGLVSGLTLSAFALASVYLAPLLSYLIGKHGIPYAFRFLGCMITPVVLIAGLQLETPPEGYVPEDRAPRKAAAEKKRVFSGRECDWRETLKEPAFYALFFTFLMVATASLLVNCHLVSIAKTQASISNTALLVSFYAVANTLGRFCFGGLSDRMRREKLFAFIFASNCLNMLCFRLYGSLPLLLIGCTVSGISFGALNAIMPVIISDRFGMVHFGANYGMISLSSSMAGVLGPILGGLLYDSTGTFASSYIFAAALLAGATVLCVLLLTDTFTRKRKESL